MFAVALPPPPSVLARSLAVETGCKGRRVGDAFLPNLWTSGRVAARDRLGQILKARQLRTMRLFVYGPLALAVFLGQQLTSIGQVQLFEYQDPGYVPSCTLRT